MLEWFLRPFILLLERMLTLLGLAASNQLAITAGTQVNNVSPLKMSMNSCFSKQNQSSLKCHVCLKVVRMGQGIYLFSFK